jgi:hypothetical protein
MHSYFFIFSFKNKRLLANRNSGNPQNLFAQVSVEKDAHFNKKLAILEIGQILVGKKNRR